jgi:hypothetical protein
MEHLIFYARRSVWVTSLSPPARRLKCPSPVCASQLALRRRMKYGFAFRWHLRYTECLLYGSGMHNVFDFAANIILKLSSLNLVTSEAHSIILSYVGRCPLFSRVWKQGQPFHSIKEVGNRAVPEWLLDSPLPAFGRRIQQMDKRLSTG